MKEHFVIKVNASFNKEIPPIYPYWKDLITDRSLAVDSFYPAFDDFMRCYSFKYWTTKEYKSQFLQWSPEEISAGLDRTYRIILQQNYPVPGDFITKLQQVPHVEEASAITVIETIIPKPRLSTQTSYTGQKKSQLINLKYGQLFTKGHPEITIAVLDTGINLQHKELQGKIIFPADFVNIAGLDTTEFIGDINESDEVPEDEVGHGTHVSGIIAAKGINMEEGICPDCRIMPVRVLATMKSGDTLVGAGIIDNINTGIKWAVDHGANIINMSLGIQHEGGGLPHEDIIRYALSKNVTIVAASGNDGKPIKYYPGALPGVIAVGAVDDTGQIAPFSSYGAEITVVAPGSNVFSSFSNNTYAFASGTSQASPFVCGSIGLLKSYAHENGVTLSNKTIKYILQHSSDKSDSQSRNEKAGFGLINIADAFKLLQYIIHK